MLDLFASREEGSHAASGFQGEVGREQSRRAIRYPLGIELDTLHGQGCSRDGLFERLNL